MAEHKEPEGNKQNTIAKIMRRVAVMLGSVFVLSSIAWVAVNIIGENAEKAVTASSQAIVKGETTQGNAPSMASWNVNKRAALRQSNAPDYRMLALPANGQVDVSYFNTVTFVGESVMQGMEIYPTFGLPNAKYCAYKSIGLESFYDGSLVQNVHGEMELPVDKLKATAPDNVYIMAGINSIVAIQDDDIFMEKYTTMVRTFREALDPNVGFYLQTITPMRPDNLRGVSIERINNLNDRIAKLAYEEGIYFIDLHEVLADDSGYLKKEYEASLDDGIHLMPEAYAAWAQYLATHTAYHPRNPYLPGSPYYVEPT